MLSLLMKIILILILVFITNGCMALKDKDIRPYVHKYILSTEELKNNETKILKEKKKNKRHISVYKPTYRNSFTPYWKQTSFTNECNNKSLAITEKILSEESNFEILERFNRVGSNCKVKQNYKKSIEYLKTAVIIKENGKGTDDMRTDGIYSSLAQSFYNIGDYENFSKYQRKYYNSKTKRADELLYKYPEYKDLYLQFNEHSGRNDLKHSYKSINNSTPKEFILQILESWLNHKGTILDSENILVTIYDETKDPKVKGKIEELRDKKMYLAKLDQEYPTEEQAKAHQENIKNTKDKINILKRELFSKVESFKEEMNLRVLTLDNVTKYLKPNELYIDYAKAGDNYYLFTLNSKNEVTFTQIDTNDTKVIESGIKEFRDQTKYISDNLSKLKDKEIQELKTSSIANLSKLYKLLIDQPIGKTIQSYDSLIISPDGALSLLPFESLYDTNTKHYIIQDKAIRYIPSGKEFVRLNRRSEKSNEDVVVFANPDFPFKLPEDVKGVDIKHLITPNTQTRAIDVDPNEIISLKGSKEEADFIQTKYKEQAVMFTEDAARESNLLKVKEPKILHLSTHGYFLTDQNITNPMLKSGILLSGAWRTFARQNGVGGGIVSALRLSGLNLKGTELVMLSACETGVSDISNGGEGVSGLNKAFLQAGASDVAMTLWSVADKETADLIKEFYNNIKDKNYNEALREAKLEFINDKDNHKSHPYYWAGFIVSGR